MSTFKDRLGREWQLELTVGLASRVKKQTGTDLAKLLTDGGTVAAVLFGDPVGLAGLLWAVAHDQAEAQNIDQACFDDGLDGRALERGGEALLAALADLYPRSAVAQAIGGRVTQALEAMDRAAVAHLNGAPAPAAAPGGEG